jgi:hypothetical protein
MAATIDTPSECSVRRVLKCTAIGIAVLAWLSGTAAAQSTGTLTLDNLSFISFQDVRTVALPAGSTLEFQFGTPGADGSIPFTIAPSGTSIAPVDIPGSPATLLYALANTAFGTISSETPEGRIIQFSASVAATLATPDGETGTHTYAMPFTTETAVATDILGQLTIERTGLRLVEGVWYAQIVAATTNKENAFPEPGAAVYAVLSGQFDQLPIGP